VQYHPFEVLTLNAIVGSESFLEVYRQLAIELDTTVKISSRSRLVQPIKWTMADIARTQKKKILIVFDEANLLRMDTLQELHTLLIFDQDSRNAV
jgi:hypothetical protein